MRAKIARLVTFGEGGDVVECEDCRISGYGRPERPHAATPSASLIIPDGTMAIDKRPAIATEEGYRWVFRSPMVNVNLTDDEVSECPTPDPIFASAMAESGNEFGVLLAMHAAAPKTEPGPLDFVSVARYAAGWRDHGARIGVYQNGRIEWEE